MLKILCLLLIALKLFNIPIVRKGYNFKDGQHEKLVKIVQNDCEMKWSKCMKNITIKVDFFKTSKEDDIQTANEISDVYYRFGLVRVQNNVKASHSNDIIYVNTCLDIPQYVYKFEDIVETYKKKRHSRSKKKRHSRSEIKVYYVKYVGRFGARLCVKDNDCFALYKNDMIILDNRMYHEAYVSTNNGKFDKSLRIQHFSVNCWCNVICNVLHRFKNKHIVHTND